MVGGRSGWAPVLPIYVSRAVKLQQFLVHCTFALGFFCLSADVNLLVHAFSMFFFVALCPPCVSTSDALLSTQWKESPSLLQR